jgi:Tfp pilus assembly pilus retraction ATPase PilT
MQLGQQRFGMLTFSQSLLGLTANGAISRECALAAATERDELEQMLGGRGPTARTFGNPRSSP